MNPEEEAELRELQAALSAADASPWQPECIARAFASPKAGDLVFTLQTWIDLDAARSPLLLGRTPDTIEELSAACDAFAVTLDATADQALEIAEMMLETIGHGFSARLAMQPPGEFSEEIPDEGFGDWAPVAAALIAQLGLSRTEALATPVAQAFILLAADKHNHGWRVAGERYRWRDAEENLKAEG